MDPHIDSDSDEAPEEISLNKGREEAEQFRKSENENLKRLAAVKKEKRKAQLERKQEIELEKKKKQEEKKSALEKKVERNQRKKERQFAKKGIEIEDTKHAAAGAIIDHTKLAPAEPEKSRSRKRKGEQTDDDGAAPESAGKSETEKANKLVGSVMLDDKVVQLIRAREKQVEKSGGIPKHKYIREPEPEPDQKKAKPSKPSMIVSKNSRVQIVSLKRKPDASALKKALKFRDQRLFGKATHRSMTMLPKSTKKKVSV